MCRALDADLDVLSKRNKGNMEIRSLSPELQKRAEENLNEVPGRLEDDLRHIREWLGKQPHLTVRNDDQWLVSFIRGCKSSLEQTKERIDNFHTLRPLLPEFYADRDPFSPELQNALKSNIIMVLPEPLTPGGPRIAFSRMGACSDVGVSYVTIMKLYLMTLDILMKEDDNTIVAGFIAISDLKGYTASFSLQCTPTILQKSVLCFQGKYPIRFKGFHLINAPSIFDTLYNIAKVFMKEKLRKRLIVYKENNSEDVYKNIPRSILPKEYGGNAGSIEKLSADWKAKVESYREWFLEDVKYCSKESLRPGKPKTSADLFGVEGSFRKLTID